jgi:L-ribulose-5-phosphate 4-epimerase
MYEKEKRDVIKAGISMDRYSLIALSGGNVSMRMDNGDILVTPSGMIYEDMVEEDVLVVDLDGNVLEGERKASVDTEALLYIFKNRPDVNAVIHTHQPYATAIGLVQDELPCVLTTLANTTRGAVRVADYSSAASLDMGINTVDSLGDQLAVILKHHGVVSVGKDLKEALYAVIYLEEAAKCYIAAKSIGEVAVLSPEQVDKAVEVFKYYGQGAPEKPKDLT